MIFCLAIWDWDDVSLVFTGRSLDRGRMFVPPPEKTAGSGCLRRGLKIRGQDGRVQLTIEIHDLKSRTMTLRQQYFKRYRMELDLGGMLLPAASLPDHFFWVAWDATDVDRHALVKHRSFSQSWRISRLPASDARHQSAGGFFGSVHLADHS